MKAKRRWAWAIIVISIVISYLLSMTNPRIGNMEMAALLNLYLPGIIAVITLIIFLIMATAFKKLFLRYRWWVTVPLAVINAATGVYLHFFY